MLTLLNPLHPHSHLTLKTQSIHIKPEHQNPIPCSTSSTASQQSSTYGVQKALDVTPRPHTLVHTYSSITTFAHSPYQNPQRKHSHQHPPEHARHLPNQATFTTPPPISTWDTAAIQPQNFISSAKPTVKILILSFLSLPNVTIHPSPNSF